MKIRLLGTGYGICRVKKKCSFDARHKGGIIVDERILIDAPSDVFDASDALGFSDLLKGVSEIFISHSHEGHFSPDALLKMAEKRRVRVFASGEVLSLLPECERIERVELSPFIPIELADYRILPLPANHSVKESSEIVFNFIISRDKTLFYALDGGGISLCAFEYLKKEKIDALILDCAEKDAPYSAKCMQHGNFLEAQKTRAILLDAKIAGSDTKFILSHIPSDRKRAIHEELTALAKPCGFTVAYDGYFLIL
jgi:hypothetical protein